MREIQVTQKKCDALVRELLTSCNVESRGAYDRLCGQLHSWFRDGVDGICDPARRRFLREGSRGTKAGLLGISQAHLSRLRSGKRPLTDDLREAIDSHRGQVPYYPSDRLQWTEGIIACLQGLRHRFGIPKGYSFELSPEWLLAVCLARCDSEWLGEFFHDNGAYDQKLIVLSERFIAIAQAQLGLNAIERDGRGLLIMARDWLPGLLICDQCLPPAIRRMHDDD